MPIRRHMIGLLTVCTLAGCNLFTETADLPVASEDAAGIDADGGRKDGCGDCEAGEVCSENQCVCVPPSGPELCASKSASCGQLDTIDDCGTQRIVDCGTCPGDGRFCSDNACSCTSESDTDFCERLVKNCGAVSADDNCGVDRTVNCGSCDAPAECGGGGTPNVCACSAQTDADFCVVNQAECGALSAIDACDQLRTVDCGSCNGFETCAGGGTAHECGCTPESDAQLCSRTGAACGVVSRTDNCGVQRNDVDCGSCPGADDRCVSNQCACIAETDAAFCSRNQADCDELTAPDNCNVTRTVNCGVCTGSDTCTANQCNCIPENDTDFCARNDAECGGVEDVDNCGMPRTVAQCGQCTAMGAVCDRGVCQCTPQTDAEFCTANGASCGSVSGQDNCGAMRNISDCGQCGDGMLCDSGTCMVDLNCGNGTCDSGELDRCVQDCQDRPIYVGAGDEHTCAVLGDGTTRCFGDNIDGQLGDGTTSRAVFPVPSLIRTAATIAGGEQFTIALLNDGTVRAAGENINGQLGDGTTTDRSVPATTLGISNAVKVAAGHGDHACALLADGTVKCWGRNFRGQLGDGTTSEATTPVIVSGIAGAIDVAVGSEHTCAIDGTTLKCWGNGNEGQLGTGSTSNSSLPLAVTLPGNPIVVELGDSHSCAIVANNDVYCWGANFYGQVGDGSFFPKTSPARVPNIKAKALALGFDHACALLTDDTMSCWGANFDGQLGIQSSMGFQATPRAVPNISDVFQIAAGDGHTCALLLDATIRCWGDGGGGQLGDGSRNSSSTPIQPTGL